MDSAVTGLDNLIDRVTVAGRQIAGSWLGAPGVAPDGHERRVSAMAACLFSALLAPLILFPVLIAGFSWEKAIAAALAAAALPIAAGGVLALTGSLRLTGRLALAAATLALGGLAALSGGLASPILPLLALVPLEAMAMSKNRTALLWGLAAAGLALAANGALTAFQFPAGGQVLQNAGGAGLATALSLAAYTLLRGVSVAVRPANHMEATGSAASDTACNDQTGPDGASALTAADQKAREQSLLDHMPGLVTEHDARGDVVRVAGCDRLSYGERIGAVEGKGFVNRIHVADRIVFLDAFDALRRGEPRRDLELRFERIDSAGQFVHAAISLSAAFSADGRLSGAMVQTRDISEMVAARQQATAVAEEAETANAAKTRFLAAVSHELRTPLNAIIGFSDILAREYFGGFSDERQREYVGLIHQSGEHLLALVNTMLDMSKIESGRYEVFVEPFAVGEVVSECDAMLRLQASNRGVTLTRRIAPDVGEVVADRRAVQQILINLVGNAIKFTEAGGVINVDAAIDHDHLVLSVSDTGVGIPADKLARLGEPFVQVQNGLARYYEGTGLGLSLVKGLVDLHGGAFTIDSRENEGTAVTIRLPADGSGANGEFDGAEAAQPVTFPPVLTKTAKNHDAIRSEIHAETARSA